MDDLISRQAAKDLLKKRLYETALNSITEHPYYEELADNRVDVWLNELPSAERRGRWIVRYNPETGWYRITCSECGEDVTSTAPCIGFLPDVKVIWDYCPNCGERMEV